MGKGKNIGYEIGVKHPREEKTTIYCIESSGKVRSYYVDGFRHYMSDYELWVDGNEFLGKVTGEFKLGGLVSILDEKGEPEKVNGKQLKNLKIIHFKEVGIGEMVADPYVRVGSFKVRV